MTNRDKVRTMDKGGPKTQVKRVPFIFLTWIRR